MQKSISASIENEFIENPEATETTRKNDRTTKQSLRKKRELIQKQLKDLMLKVDEYQVEKKQVTKQQNQKIDKVDEKIQQKQRVLLHQFDASDSIKIRKPSKQSSNQIRIPGASKNSKTSMRERSNSQKSTQLPLIDKQNKLRSSQQKQKYINYLPQIDFKTPLPRKIPSEQKKKQKLLNYLQKAQQYEKDAIKKIGQINRGKDKLNYLDYLKVESQVDDVFLNCLRSRLQCALKM